MVMFFKLNIEAGKYKTRETFKKRIRIPGLEYQRHESYEGKQKADAIPTRQEKRVRRKS